MKRNSLTYIFILTLLLMLALGAKGAVADAGKLRDRYNDKKTITMACDMEFAPYEFRNDGGKPAGFNVELAEMVVGQMGLSLNVVMKDWPTVLAEMKQRKIDIMLVASLKDDLPGLYYSKIAVTPYRVAIAFKQGTQPITKFSSIPTKARVAVKQGDYCATAALRAGMKCTQLSYCTPRQALYGLQNGDYDYFIYCDLPLRWHIREYNMDDIQVRALDLPGKSFRFVSNDRQLLNDVDDQLMRIMQEGSANKLKNKWLVHDRETQVVETRFLIVLFVIVVIVLAVIVLNRIVVRKVKTMLRETMEVNRILGDALLASRNNVIAHNLRTHVVTNVSGNWLPKKGMTIEEFRQRIHPDDRDKVTFISTETTNANDVANKCQYRWNIGTETNPIWRTMVNQPVPDIDKSGRIVNIISTVTDITDLMEKQRAENEMANRFIQIFDNSLVGFALYSADGSYIESNAKFKDILRFDVAANRIYYETTNVFDFSSVSEAMENRGHDVYLALCTSVKLYGTSETQYVELRLRHIADKKGNIVYHMITVTNSNEDRNNFIKSREGDENIRTINKRVQQYESELRYLLESSHMRVWSTSKDDNEARFFKDLRSYEVKMSIEEFVSKVVRDEDKDLALRLADATYNKCQPVVGTIKIKNLFTPNGGERWYSINSIPNYDNDGTLLGCFGLIRDVTLMVDSQEKLRVETARANASDQQKSAFLANMSHEIRTPLNAIVGFCDLLQAVDEPEEKKEFMRIIRNNCDMLLMLIDDILTLSTIDGADGQLRFREIDFAPAFDDMCTSLEQRVASKPGIEFIQANPYAHLATTLDKDKLQQVVINFVTNAVKNTEQGHIKVGLEMVDDGLRIYCEDTGCGIPKDKCEQIFQRFVKLNDFVQGAGLGLSICKKIAEMYRGKIGVDSEVGVGSTFWLWVPCKMDNVELKDEQ